MPPPLAHRPRLSVTSVRLADELDVAADPTLTARPDEIVLVVGQPVLGRARLDCSSGMPRLLAHEVAPGLPERDRGDLETMLRFAAAGLIRDAGASAPGDGERPPPSPRDAVSVLPLRDGPDGIEAFVQHRVATMDFAAGAVVFPGGRVDPGDLAAGAALTIDPALIDAHEAAWRHTAALPGGARTLLATACREVAEETGAVLDPSRLVPWDDWITPVGYPRRFDVRFLLYAAPPAEQAAFGHTTTEAHRSEWLPLAEIVRATEAGRLALLPPTRTLVDELSALASVADVLALRPTIAAVEHDLTPRRPRPAAGARAGVRGDV